MELDASLVAIYQSFDGKLVGRHELKHWVCETLTHFPLDIVEYVTTTCWFMGSLEEAWAFTLTGNDLKDNHIIFLGDELFTQPPQQIQFTIAHEIGHVMLGHRNSVLEQQSPEEIRQQEIAADTFVEKYLRLK